MIQRSLSALWILTFAALTACNNEKAVSEVEVPNFNNLIPTPVMARQDGGSFGLNDSTVIVITPANKELLRMADYLAAVLKPATGFSFKIDSAAKTTNSITLGLVNDSLLKAEGYELKITANGIALNANQPAGLFYGVQTIRQLLPAAIEKKTAEARPMANSYRYDSGLSRIMLCVALCLMLPVTSLV